MTEASDKKHTTAEMSERSDDKLWLRTDNHDVIFHMRIEGKDCKDRLESGEVMDRRMVEG